MTQKTIAVCDNCKKEKECIRNLHTPLGWIRVSRISMNYRDEETQSTDNGHSAYIDESKDPDFCCKKCAEKWFSNLIDSIIKGSYNKGN